MKTIQAIIFILATLTTQLSIAGEKTLIRLGVLAFGTVNWELAAMQQAQVIETEHYRLQVLKIANPQAGKIALQSGAVDMIVADWIWVSRQRFLGKDYTFFPYSNTTGALVVPKDSPIKQLADLKNRKLAVAGGELDKNSLLLRALMQQQGLASTFASVEKIYGAPPLLTQQMIHKRVDALLTYWHYAARLESEGYRVLITGGDILQGLGIKEKVPSIGYVFDKSWATEHKQAVEAFLEKSRQTKDILCIDDAAWLGIQSLTQTKTEQASQLLRQKYCDGRVLSWGVKEQQAAGKIYQHLKAISQKRLTGGAKTLQAGSFW